MLAAESNAASLKDQIAAKEAVIVDCMSKLEQQQEIIQTLEQQLLEAEAAVTQAELVRQKDNEHISSLTSELQQLSDANTSLRSSVCMIDALLNKRVSIVSTCLESIELVEKEHAPFFFLVRRSVSK